MLPALAPVAPVLVEFKPELTRYGAKLLSGSELGMPVHAGTFLRERRMVLESALLGRGAELRRILIHELFHFVWMRLGNARRRDWASLLAAELANKARGELGWSAESRKIDLTAVDSRTGTLRWREYVCESFCDTAAWRHAGLAKHEEYTLARRWRNGRVQYFDGIEARALAL